MPGLSLSALEKQIASRKLGGLYVFLGEDVKLVERIVDAVEATVEEADRPFAVERMYAGEPGGAPVAIAAAARIYPMLGDRRIVVVLRAERLLKPKRATKPGDDDVSDEAEEEAAADLGALEDYIASPVASTTLLFVATEIDRGRRFTKRLLEKAQVVEFGGLGGGANAREGRSVALEWLKEELARANRPIDPSAAQLLVERAAGDITKLRGDLERLLIYTEGQKKITRDDVAEIASAGMAVEDEWGMVNAIADGNIARALRELTLRFERGDSPHQLVGYLRWWVSSRLSEGDPDRVRPALESLLRTDVALKSSGGDEQHLVEKLVVELTGKPLPRRQRW